MVQWGWDLRGLDGRFQNTEGTVNSGADEYYLYQSAGGEPQQLRIEASSYLLDLRHHNGRERRCAK